MVGSRQLVLTDAEKATIASAIEAAEATTAGEIFCVVARKSGDYGWTTLVYGAVLALVIPLILLLMAINPLDLADWFARLSGGGWSVGTRTSPADEASAGMAILLSLQALIFIIVSLIGLNEDIREALTPAFVKRQNVHRSALEQFLAQGIHLTENRTGVLVFVSLSEHQAEIVADAGIYQKVEPTVWREAVASLLKHAKAGDLASGLVAAITQSGKVLSDHFPIQTDDRDELPNRVIII